MAEAAITTGTYAEGLAQHRILGSRAKDGSTIFVPPRQIDPADPTAAMESIELSGKGTLLSFSVVPVGSSQMIAAGYGKTNPYGVGLVKLDEGPTVSAQIIGVDMAKPDSIALGMPMEAEFIERPAGNGSKTVLAFRPRGI